MSTVIYFIKACFGKAGPTRGDSFSPDTCILRTFTLSRAHAAEMKS